MKTMTDHLLDLITPQEAYDALLIGKDAARGDRCALKTVQAARLRYAKVRARYGAPAKHAALLTAPEGNLKLAKGEIPSYGLTLHHYVHRSKFRQLPTMNLCPKAGDCTKVCVVSNGHGERDTTQRAWRTRTDFLALVPDSFLAVLGWELERAVIKHNDILLRPNVNSDIQWERIAPALVDGSLWGARVISYGYTKLTDYLDGDGWITPYYRVAYSWNEHTDPDQALAFVYRGGSVAVVTDRKPGEPVKQWDPSIVVSDADKTDEWIFGSAVIGDLSAKGRARKLIGRSGFVHQRYGAPVPVSVGALIKAGRDS